MAALRVTTLGFMPFDYIDPSSSSACLQSLLPRLIAFGDLMLACRISLALGPGILPSLSTPQLRHVLRVAKRIPVPHLGHVQANGALCLGVLSPPTELITMITEVPLHATGSSALRTAGGRNDESVKPVVKWYETLSKHAISSALGAPPVVVKAVINTRSFPK